MANDYYEIAINDLLFLEHNLNVPSYNVLALQSQQITEKALKSVLELVAVGNECKAVLQSHNLKNMYTMIHEVVPSFELNRSDLALLKDYYYDAKYPGENFVRVTKEACQECINIMYDVLEQVNQFRTEDGMKIFPVERKQLHKDLEETSWYTID